MARGRDPARDKAKLLWLNAGGERAPKGILKDIALELGKSDNQIRKWKNLDNWGSGNKTKSNSNVTKSNGNVTIGEKAIKKKVIEEFLDDIEENELNDMQTAFCIHYIQCFNGKQAAIKAGYKPTAAYTMGSRLLNNPKVKNYLLKLKQSYDRELFLDGKRLLDRHMKIAFSDIFDFIDGQRRLKPIEELDGTLIKDFSYSKEETDFDGGSTTKTNIKLKVEDRKDSLKFLSKYFGLGEEVEEEEEEINTIEVVKICHS